MSKCTKEYALREVDRLICGFKLRKFQVGTCQNKETYVAGRWRQLRGYSEGKGGQVKGNSAYRLLVWGRLFYAFLRPT